MTDGCKRPSQSAMQSPPPKRLTRSSVKNVSTKLTDEHILDILNNQPKVLIKGASIVTQAQLQLPSSPVTTVKAESSMK